MLKYLTVILVLFVTTAFGQQLEDSNSSTSESAEQALKTYIKVREGYKRSNTKQFSRDEQLEMDDLCFDMQKKFPDAWQTDYAWYINGHYTSNKEKLKEAYSKSPTDKRLVKAMFGYYVLVDDVAKQKQMVSKVAKYYSTNELAYYEDALPSSGVLIVSSEKDALPLYVLQQVKGKGKGVTIVTMDYLIDNSYRLRMANKLGTGSAKFFGSERTFIKTAMGSKNVFLSSTVSQSYITGMGSDAYLIGLHYQGYIRDQKEKLEKFWIKVAPRNFASMSLTSSEKRLYSNYLPPLMTLYKMKLAVGVKDEVLRKAIVAISGKVEQTKTVNKILIGYDNG